ncbi:hypothetical protein JHK82_033600 [Glycine max]|nr:hypothetical protein JHK82_033600 [Glycine max]
MEDKPSVYPFVDYNDLIKNLFPEDVIAAKSPFVPPEATEEVLLWIPGVILNLIDKDYNVDLACSDFFGILFWLGDKVVSVYMRVADEIQCVLENVKKKEQVLDDFGAREVSLIDLELGKKKEMMEGWFHVIICYLYIE